MAQARDVMSDRVISVREDEDIYTAIRAMAANEITGLPVVDAGGNLVGVITEKDVLALLYTMQDKPGTVRDFMSTEVVCFGPESDLAQIAETLRTNNFRRVPILDQGRLVGIVSRRDIIRYMRELRYEDRLLRDSILELVF
ncbi:MAG: CBS domain-containing protein [Phycisphaerales bacterium]